MFSENEAPADLFTDAPNPSSWYMKPDALFSAASTCNIAERFKDMKIVISKFIEYISDDTYLRRAK
jgi:hypothetical protein